MKGDIAALITRKEMNDYANLVHNVRFLQKMYDLGYVPAFKSCESLAYLAINIATINKVLSKDDPIREKFKTDLGAFIDDDLQKLIENNSLLSAELEEGWELTKNVRESTRASTTYLDGVKAAKAEYHRIGISVRRSAEKAKIKIDKYRKDTSPKVVGIVKTDLNKLYKICEDILAKLPA